MSADNDLRTKLDLLQELQELDTEIMEFEDEREKIPRQTNDMKAMKLEKQRMIDEIDNQIGGLEDSMNEKQRLLELEAIKLKNTRNKETAIQNIKQYEAYIKEVETQEESSEDIEREIITIKERLKTLQEQRGALFEEQKQRKGEQTKEKAELELRLVALDKSLDELYDKRDERIERVSEDLYLKYEHISERIHDGIAVSLLQNGHCLACNMAVLPQMENEIMAGKRLHRCSSCGRILVYKDVD